MRYDFLNTKYEDGTNKIVFLGETLFNPGHRKKCCVEIGIELQKGTYRKWKEKNCSYRYK